MQIPFENAYVELQMHLPELSVKEVLHRVQAPVNCVQAEQLEAQGTHKLLPGLNCPVGHVFGFTQAVPLKAVVELQPHRPVVGVFVVNDLLQPVQKPVLLHAVQFDEHATHVFVPSLNLPVGHTVKVEVQVVPLLMTA